MSLVDTYIATTAFFISERSSLSQWNTQPPAEREAYIASKIRECLRLASAVGDLRAGCSDCDDTKLAKCSACGGIGGEATVCGECKGKGEVPCAGCPI